MGVGAGLYMYVVVIQKFTFAISSPDEFLLLFNERELMCTFAMCCRPSTCRLSVCLSVTFVHPTQAVVTFGNISTALGTLAIR